MKYRSVLAFAIAGLIVCVATWFLVVHEQPGSTTASHDGGEPALSSQEASDAGAPDAEIAMVLAAAQQRLAAQPELAAQLLDQINSPEGDDERHQNAAALAKVIEEAGERAAEDPERALTWAFEQGDTTARSAVEVVLDIWSSSDPAAAFSAVTRLAGSGADPTLCAFGHALIAGNWVATDPVAAMDGIASLPASASTSVLQGQILTRWAEESPAAAAVSLQSLLRKSSAGGSENFGILAAIPSVAYQFTASDLEKSLEWVLAFPAGSSAQASALTGAISAWMREDPPAVSRWLEALEPGVLRDNGIQAMIQDSMLEVPEIELQWTEKISDEALRQLISENTASRWLAVDPEVAEAWIRGSPLFTDEQREALIETNREIMAKMDGSPAPR